MEDTMKHLVVVLLFVGIAVLYTGCSDNNPTAPNLSQNDQVTATLDKDPAEAAGLFGEMRLYWSPGWDGRVTFEGNGTYGIRFFHEGDKMAGWVAYFFQERWEIYDTTDATNFLMAGSDEGVSPGPKFPDPCKYVMNGYVEEAYGEFEKYIGHGVHMSGVMTFDSGGTPLTAPGIFRLH